MRRRCQKCEAKCEEYKKQQAIYNAREYAKKRPTTLAYRSKYLSEHKKEIALHATLRYAEKKKNRKTIDYRTDVSHMRPL
jgi:D-alanine-D-alanine ligase-like ATP-grasp enzyme